MFDERRAESEIQRENEEYYDKLLANIQSHGYNVTRLELGEIRDNTESISVLILHTDSLETVQYIFDIGDIAYGYGNRPDRYMIKVDDDKEYWITKSDISKYKSKSINYENKLYVNFPFSQRVRLEDLPDKIEKMSN